jgi:hypothetical protein
MSLQSETAPLPPNPHPHTLHQTMDASVWAKEFCILNPDADESVMLTWFANAIMVGYDTAMNRCNAATV